MPLYDYRCKDCGHQFEELVSAWDEDDDDIVCSRCSARNTERLMGAPVAISSTSCKFYSEGKCAAPENSGST